MIKPNYTKSLGCAAIALTGAALLFQGTPKAYSQAPVLQRVPTGQPAAQTLGKVVINPDLTVDLYGYFTLLEGATPSSLFNGATQNENTAVLTYRADRVGAKAFQNGAMFMGLERPLQGNSTPLNIYYHPSASARDWKDAETFKQGQLVARYQSRGAAVAVYPGAYVATSGLSLEQSAGFSLGGRTLNARDVAPGMGLSLVGPAAPVADLLAALVRGEAQMIDQAGTGYSAATN